MRAETRPDWGRETLAEEAREKIEAELAQCEAGLENVNVKCSRLNGMIANLMIKLDTYIKYGETENAIKEFTDMNAITRDGKLYVVLLSVWQHF